ncbi:MULTISPECIES: EscU/YscU/HrcU family type III secretion system export apparatus switch protein [unclassified Candidatus Frackibacter]|uniref:EscU/YscU/HrcU family type III secretion system export apparatus switch protein n=1 Tax=unclassified Candidatus Frackibacter TaxID=2648818 RepID=UPI00088A15D2|nr:MULTISPECIES: EscU/YscU/HrcU family type III secretion system export apparatus switch protein [unclassified Candidatus Frackibacter]SDC61218.1 flagellar biosynthesis protein [Candidatus Frackibacter sp. WG11]SEM75048.1 flagellar biosynthesis protein [Candidatus Frackibacter sp. WG12]SFL87191.1 flagellar biosynthesis protein [Candidatus Frackibacter sp. WG13]
MNDSKPKNKNKNTIKERAVALKYDSETNEAPQIIAKGDHEIAKKIITKAKENDIPIYEDKDLIENLIQLDLGKEIPNELYQVVAEVLSFIYQLNDNS